MPHRPLVRIEYSGDTRSLRSPLRVTWKTPSTSTRVSLAQPRPVTNSSVLTRSDRWVWCDFQERNRDGGVGVLTERRPRWSARLS